ncbi:SusD/RagB family nutrient-binding outer membrane lipoprotein [Chitinophaga caeni]|uniref:SusD/RagB family nutrient-binding outer membrane lipoprotein n=1 Tax=Chitinophaga caeni TaxID=2029983 RepID=A0A291QXK4_9BACT|nr:SusD/RagB family nutrient-binding outer membrane lipoprotein [Chitinophaga caeni]ATL48678.1 SusD/RagB family nutrient-binding outer membrane lipoprotein [Chitinophaga caeni]
MKLLKYSFYILASAGLLLSACRKDFEEINTDPNKARYANPETLIGPSLIRMVQVNQNRCLRINNELMQVHVTTINSDEIHRYVIRPAESDYLWNNWYPERTDFLDIYRGGVKLDSNSTYMGIGLILDAWNISLLTDMFGDVPYSEANMGRYEDIYQPKFDKQEDIYMDVFKKLEAANTLLAKGVTVAEGDATLDYLYHTDPALWRKFGNSLYLRLLLRVSGKAEANAPAKMQEIVANPSQYPLFANNDESAILRFTTTPPFVSAFNTYRDYDFNGDNGLSTFFINNLKEWDDPRINKWASKVSGTFEGISSGYAVGDVPERQSYYLAALKNEPLLGNILNYPELQFILAEAALKGYISGSAQSFYEEGVKAALNLWGYEMPDNYLSREGIKWNESDMEFDKMEKIHLQKYYTMFFTDFQQWYEYRRTGHPVLPKGPGLRNDGKMPSRLNYPVMVQTLNATNYKNAVEQMGPDDINTKVWWNK